jgi:hypothetical protein
VADFWGGMVYGQRPARTLCTASRLRCAGSPLNAWDVRWALVGGFAVSVRSEPHVTRDVHVVVVGGDDQAAERLVRSLIDEGYRLDAIVEQDSVGQLTTARMISPGADRLGVVVDVQLGLCA